MLAWSGSGVHTSSPATRAVSDWARISARRSGLRACEPPRRRARGNRARRAGHERDAAVPRRDPVHRRRRAPPRSPPGRSRRRATWRQRQPLVLEGASPLRCAPTRRRRARRRGRLVLAAPPAPERHVGEVAGAGDHHGCGTVSHEAPGGADHQWVKVVEADRPSGPVGEPDQQRVVGSRAARASIASVAMPSSAPRTTTRAPGAKAANAQARSGRGDWPMVTIPSSGTATRQAPLAGWTDLSGRSPTRSA